MNDRYLRQTILSQIGIAGQDRLNSASVLCIGAGGLGSPVLLYLAAAGIGHIGIVDDDVVDIGNLQRQILFTSNDIGMKKVEAAKKNLLNLNPHINITIYNNRINHKNATAIITKFDVIIDGTDNASSKFLLNDICVKNNKPMIYGSALGFTAQVATFWGQDYPCYRCLFPQMPQGHMPSCSTAGIIGAAAGIAGSMQAMEAIKMALGLSWCQTHQITTLLGKLWTINTDKMENKLFTVIKNPDCWACNATHNQHNNHDYDDIIDDVVEISLSQLQEIATNVTIIDVREECERSSQIIDNSLFMPFSQLISHNLTTMFPTHKPLVFYCQHGERSLYAAAHAIKNGFTNVSHLRGGIVRWFKEN